MTDLTTGKMLEFINQYLINNVGTDEYNSIFKSWVLLEHDDYNGIKKLYQKVKQL